MRVPSCLAQYGRKSLGDITREVDGKSGEEVAAYSETFWKRYKELTDWERVIKNIGAPPWRATLPVPTGPCCHARVLHAPELAARRTRCTAD